MTSELTPERRAAIRARCEKATSGPWKAADGQLLCDSGWDVVLSCCNIDDSTLEFVAHSRTDLPDLLAALDAAEAEVALTRGELDAAYEMASRLIAEKKALAEAGDRMFENATSGSAVSLIEAAQAWRSLRGTGEP